jgi:DNA-binding NtrC family response regulator
VESDMTDKISILVVDDEKDSRSGIAHFLKKSSYDVVTAEDGKEAWEFFKANHHDLVLTDMRMPGISGIDLLKRVKTIAPRTKVIIITAYGEVESYLEAMNHGAFEYLNKPIKIKELIKLINKAASQNKSVGWNKESERNRKFSRSI